MIFRIARHTNDLKSLTDFYTGILNFEVLGSFVDHDRYDGVFIGRKELNWHLEFTTSNKVAAHTFDADDLLVFYPTNSADYHEIVQRIKKNNIQIHRTENPYWNRNGIMIKDPDGYNIVISKLKAT